MIKLYNLILFSILLLSCPTHSQQYNFEITNQEKGFPSSSVNKIFKGSNGLLWYGTEGAGLIRYDGNSFISHNEYKNTENLFITDIIENFNKELLVATKYRGLLIFDGNKFINEIKYATINGAFDSFDQLLKTDKSIYGISKIEFIVLMINTI
ncbi:MAG: hypothetical protein HC854_16610 [Flavobacterium sp.]|nr:hypothetical protein [Flavobacterium sp.]